MSVASPMGITQAEQEIDTKDDSLKPSTEAEPAQREMDIKLIDSSTSKHRSASPDEPAKKNKKSRRRSRSISRSRTRSRSRSKSRSRSRSRNHSSRSRSRSRSRGREHRTRSRSRTYSPVKTSSGSRRVVNGRIHVSDFDSSISRHDLEKAFEKYGKIVDIWLASYPPFYAFITFKKDEDAEQAIRKMNDAYVRSHRVRVAHALPKRESFHAVRHGGRYSGGWSGYGGCRRRRSFTKSPIRDSRRSRRSRTRERSHSRSRSRSSSHSSRSTRSRSR